jgi:hypothetical protein
LFLPFSERCMQSALGLLAAACPALPCPALSLTHVPPRFTGALVDQVAN